MLQPVTSARPLTVAVDTFGHPTEETQDSDEVDKELGLLMDFTPSTFLIVN